MPNLDVSRTGKPSVKWDATSPKVTREKVAERGLDPKSLDLHPGGS